MKKTLLTFAILIGFIFAEDPTLNIQGVLRDETGAAVPDGDNYQLTFHLYNAQAGGSSIWSENHTGVSVHNGVYSAELGGMSSLGGLAFDVPYYLGISVNGGAISTPRIPLSMSPYSLSVRGTSNVFPNDGNVGVGCIDPDMKLEIRGGNLEIQNDNEDSFIRFHDPWDRYVYMGMDHSDGHQFKIGFGPELQDNPALIINDDTGDATLGNHLTVDGKVAIQSTEDVDLTGGALQIGNQNGESVAIDGNEIQARNNGEASTLYLNHSGGWTETGSLSVKGNILFNTHAPIILRSYEVGSQFSYDLDTGVSTTDYAAMVVGVDEGHMDYNETHSGWAFACLAHPQDNTWWIRMRERADTAPDWRIHVMFIRKELVSDERTHWQWQ